MAIKAYAKQKFASAIKSEQHSLLKAVEDYEIISFDIFDTLVFRYVPTSLDVIKVMASKASYSLGISEDDFYNARVQAEIDAVKKKSPCEATLDEIYSEMGLSQQQIQTLMAIEEECEVNLTLKNPSVFEVFDKCIKLGKRVILVSDTPLSRECITRILESCGITGYSKLYLSSEEDVRKHSKQLFEVVVREEKTDASSILHIGNALKSDYLNAKKSGLGARLVDDSDFGRNGIIVSEKNRQSGGLYHEVLCRFIENNERADYSDYEKIGYEVLGPLLLSFAWWLNGEISSQAKQKSTQVFFLAREGVLLHDAFLKVFPSMSSFCSILRVSRKAIIGCSLANIETIEELFAELKTFSVDSLSLEELCQLGFLDLRQAEVFAESNKIEMDHNFFQDEGLGGNDLKERFNHDILPHVRKRSAEQNRLFLRYLNIEHLQDSNVSIVDVGWRGTMQDKLSKLILSESENCMIRGYYYGVQRDPRMTGHTIANKYGAVFVDDGKQDDDLSLIDFTGQIFELMFMDTKKGTVREYKEVLDEDQVLPVFDESEYSGDTPTIIDGMQQAALAFMDDYLSSELCINENVHFTCNDAFEIYRDLASNPSNKVLSLFRVFSTKDVSTTPLVSSHGLMYWVLRPKQFISTLKANHCKSLFLKSVFKIPLPYLKMLSWLKRNRAM